MNSDPWKLKGNIMSAKNSSATPADVAAKVEEKKDATVPSQVTPEENVTYPEQSDEKLSFKQRMRAMTEKLKANKKSLISMGAVASVVVATVVVAVKYINQNSPESVEDTDASTEEDNTTEEV